MHTTIPPGKLVIYNDYGLADISKPFKPFGPVANQHSSLIVGSSIFLGKRISVINISLAWDNLPADFSEYYAAYKKLNYSFNNQCFRFSASILHKGNWLNLKVLPNNSLFESDKNGTLRKVSSFILKTENDVILITESKKDEPFSFTEKSTEGFLKIQLIEPPYGFGSSVYPNVVSKIALENASGKKLPFPNIPYSPTASSITVSFY